MKTRYIGKKDIAGKDIHVGDAFEYGDCIYIIYEDEDGEIFVRQFENQVQYGVDMDACYVERLPMRIEDMQFELSPIIGNIENNNTVKELYERELNFEEYESDEYDEDDE